MRHPGPRSAQLNHRQMLSCTHVRLNQVALYCHPGNLGCQPACAHVRVPSSPPARMLNPVLLTHVLLNGFSGTWAHVRVPTLLTPLPARSAKKACLSSCRAPGRRSGSWAMQVVMNSRRLSLCTLASAAGGMPCAAQHQQQQGQPCSLLLLCVVFGNASLFRTTAAMVATSSQVKSNCTCHGPGRWPRRFGMSHVG